MDKHKDTMNKRVRRHTWTDSPEQESNPSKKERHFSAPNSGTSNEPDLLGTILSGMKSPKAEVSKWECQPNYLELVGKKRETKWQDEKPHNQWWSTDPLQLEPSPTTKMSNSSKSDNNLSIERKKLQAKARSLNLTFNNDKKLAKGIDVEWEPPKYLKNKQKDKSNGKKNYERSHAKREKDTRPQVKKEKFSWKGAERLGSTREAWRPDRAYDFGRNHMEINDVETPNDDFQLARIV